MWNTYICLFTFNSFEVNDSLSYIQVYVQYLSLCIEVYDSEYHDSGD